MQDAEGITASRSTRTFTWMLRTRTILRADTLMIQKGQTSTPMSDLPQTTRPTSAPKQAKATWVRIYATRRILAGEELFLDYGKDFWHMMRASTERSEVQWAASVEFPSYLNDDSQPTPNANHTPTKTITTTMDDGHTDNLILGHYNTNNPTSHTHP